MRYQFSKNFQQRVRIVAYNESHCAVSA